MVEMKGIEGEIPAHPQVEGKDGFPPSNNNNNAANRLANPLGSKNDVIDSLRTVNQDLLISKTFYFFFFSAFGSLFPLMAVYFKQMGMNPSQCGLLIGVRPFVEFLAAPFWGSMADRFRKGKTMLLFSLASWIIFTLALAFIQPPAASCVGFNETQPSSNRMKEKRSIPEDPHSSLETLEFDKTLPTQNVIEPSEKFASATPLTHIETTTMQSKKEEEEESSEQKIHDMRNRRREDHGKDVSPKHAQDKSPDKENYEENRYTPFIIPPFSSIVYKAEDVQEVFFLLMLLVILGEFFSAPAITLADSATLCYLADNTDNYGKQRMFGSLGWGLAMFFVGIALDHSTTFSYHPCGPHERERNYTICFATFSVLMGCAFIASTQFKFDYDAIDDQIAMKPVVIENGPQPKGTSLPSFLTEGTVIDDSPIPLPPPKEQPQTKSTVFAQTTRELPEWLTVLKTFANLRYGAFLYVTWFMGFGIGLVFTFLFWHLQDLGGTPTLFGVASVINHVSEIFAYFFSFKFIRQIGHTKVLCIGLAGNVCRFLYISWLEKPWWVLPFEFVQGITHAAVWAACCSYITQATPANLRSSAQGVLQGLHHGLGRGCGAVIGGIFVNYFGTRVTFRGYGFACLIVLVLFMFVNYYKTDKGFSSFQDDQEPDTVVEETAHLAPHGVPSNPMARSLSKQNLGTTSTNNNNEGGGAGGYGTAEPTSNTTGGFLGVPGGGGNYGGTGGTNYTADFNMNPTIPLPNGAWTRKALAAAFNPKGILAQASSPEALFEYQFIKRNFQAYEEVTTMNETENGNLLPKGHILVSPMPKTRLYAPQPQNQSDNSYSYNW